MNEMLYYLRELEKQQFRKEVVKRRLFSTSTTKQYQDQGYLMILA